MKPRGLRGQQESAGDRVRVSREPSPEAAGEAERRLPVTRRVSGLPSSNLVLELDAHISVEHFSVVRAGRLCAQMMCATSRVYFVVL